MTAVTMEMHGGLVVVESLTGFDSYHPFLSLSNTFHSLAWKYFSVHCPEMTEKNH